MDTKENTCLPFVSFNWGFGVFVTLRAAEHRGR